MNNLFISPEKPFLLFYKIYSKSTYAWFETKEEMQEMIDKFTINFNGSDYNFVIQDVFEIGSLREVKMDKICGNCENYQPYACEQKVGCCKDIAMLDVKPSDKCHKVYR